MIRLAKRSDIKDILRIYAPYVLDSHATFELEVPSEEAFWAKVQKVMKEAPWLVFEIGRQVVGYAYAAPHRQRPAYKWNRELSVYIDPAFQGRGIGSALYTALIELLKIQGYANTLIGITLPNEPSVRFHERFGFRLVGIYHHIGFKHGQFYDVGWWELPILTSIVNEKPGQIKPLQAIVRSEAWREALKKGMEKVRDKGNR